MVENISLVLAFSGGLLSFLSPCVLPLVPVYLASLYGPEINEAGQPRARLPLFFHSLSFVIGFSVVFVALGAVAGLTGFAINPSQVVLNKVAGGLLIAFGLFMLVALKVPWLNYEKRIATSVGHPARYIRSFAIGAAFAPAWTACVGPILGGILALALNTATSWQGAYLLGAYSLGLGVPFLVLGAAFDSVMPVLRRIRRYLRLVQVFSGLLLIAVGLLVLTGNLARVLSF